mmetsp:Transcript_23779/g.33371  ORF Transcript_23779/g.33371 Transcript_23779/m.33371 type:complete len:443 (+) Transcript_23779:433-1761(+)
MSAFLAYSNTKRAALKRNNPSLTNGDISKLLSASWKGEPEEERQKYISKARNLHDEYIIERDIWRRHTEKERKKQAKQAKANKLLGVVADGSEFGNFDGTGGYKSHEQHPDAPKRPMSAFLAYSNSKRAALKRNDPTLKNGDLSKILSKAWKDEPETVRQKYIEDARKRRGEFKVDMAAWCKEFDKRKRDAAKKRKDEQQRTHAANKKARRAAAAAAVTAAAANAVGGFQNEDYQKSSDSHVDPTMQQNAAGPMGGGSSGFSGMPEQSAVGLIPGQGGNANIMGMVPVLGQAGGLQQVFLGQAGLPMQHPHLSLGTLATGAPGMQINPLVANQAALQAQMLQPFSMGAGAATLGGLQAGAALNMNNAASLQGAQFLLNSLNSRLSGPSADGSDGVAGVPSNSDINTFQNQQLQQQQQQQQQLNMNNMNYQSNDAFNNNMTSI